MRAAALVAAAVLTVACSGQPRVPETPGNTLRWQAASEQGVFGYLVYRSENREGPFRRINDTIVRVPVDVQDRHAYTFVDDDAEPGKTYFYYLDVVLVTGLKQRFSGIIEK